MLKKFIKDSLVYAVPTAFSSIVSLILVPIYTRILSPEDYGLLDMLLAFASIANLVLALEINQAIARFVPSENDPIRKRVTVSTAFWFTISVYSLFLISLEAFPTYFSFLIFQRVDLGATYHTLVAYLWFNGVFFFVLNALRAELQSAKYSFLMTLMTVVSACVTLYLMNEYGLGIDGLLAGMTIANTIPVFVGLWWLRSNLLAGFDISFLKKMLVFSFPLMLAGIAFWGSIYIDRIMINDLLSLADVGVYGVGYRLSSVISIVVAGVRSAFLPLVYSNLRDRETPAKIAIILRTYLFVVLFLYLVASLFATDLIVLFTSQSFYQASNTLVFLMPAIILANMDIFAPGIGISQKSSILIWTNLGSATLNLALNYVLIPVLGITGAAVATMTSSLLLTIVMISISQRLYYIPYAWLPIVLCSTIALSIAVLVPLLHIGTYMRVTVNICSLIAFLFLSMKLQLLKPTDAVDLKSVIQPSAETN